MNINLVNNLVSPPKPTSSSSNPLSGNLTSHYVSPPRPTSSSSNLLSGKQNLTSYYEHQRTNSHMTDYHLAFLLDLNSLVTMTTGEI